MDSPSPVRHSSIEASSLDTREATLLTQRLKSAESALEEERSLNVRERAVLAERLAYVEAQDAATRERLAQALASLATQNSELQETMLHVATEDAEHEEHRLRCENMFENQLRVIEAEKHTISQEVQQAVVAREKISSILKQRDSDLDAEVAERNRLAVALRLQEQEVEEQRMRCRDESARAGSEQRRLEMELQQLLSGKEAAVSRMGELEMMLQGELQAGKAASAKISQSEQERLCQSTELTELLTLRFKLEEESLDKDRQLDRMALEIQEARREGDSRSATLHDEVMTVRSRERAEVAELQRSNFDLERRLQLSVSHESAALMNLEARERERVAELRATLRSEMRMEVSEAEAAAKLRIEAGERGRQGELQAELLESAENRWRLRTQHEEADIERNLHHEHKLLALENEARACEEQLRTEIHQTREAFRCLEAASDMRIAALQQNASQERVVSAEQCEQLRGSLQSEMRELRSKVDQESKDAAERIERAERRDRDTQKEVCTELHRLRDDILVRPVNIEDTIKVEVLQAQIQDLTVLYRKQEIVERELRAELQTNDRILANGFQQGAEYALHTTRHLDFDDSPHRSLSKIEEMAKQREASLRAEFDRRECMLKAQFQGELHDEQKMLQARLHAEQSDTGVVHARLHAEIAEAKGKQNQEADAAASANVRCREMERRLQTSNVENSTLRHRIQQLEAENLALSQIGSSIGQGGEAIKEECRWRSFALENSVRAAEAEAQAARTELQQGNIELQRAVVDAQSEAKMACEHAKDEARQWRAALSSARESERLAMEELKRCEGKRKEDLIRMDTLISDTQVLSHSLNEHQHLAKDLNNMIQRQEESLSKPTSPARSMVSFDAPLITPSTLTRELSRVKHHDVLSRHVLTPSKVLSPRSASPRHTTPDPVESWANISTTINRDIAHLSRRAGNSSGSITRPATGVNWATPVGRASTPSLLNASDRISRSLSPAFNAWSPASSTTSPAVGARARSAVAAHKDTTKPSHSSWALRHGFSSPGSQPYRSSIGGRQGRQRPSDLLV